MVTEISSFLTKHQLSETEWEQSVQNCLSILFEYRNNRVRPSLDDKQLCSWNALMIKGLVDAYKASLNEKYLVQAENTLNFILNNLLNGTKLYRSFKNNEVKVNAFLDDYAFLIRALISVHEITCNDMYLEIAQSLSSHCMQEFYDSEHKMFYYTASSSENLVARKQEFYDSVIPSSNAVMQENLHLLSLLTGSTSLGDISENMMVNMLDTMKRYPPSFSAWASYLLNKKVGNTEIVIVGAEAKEFYKSILQSYLPGVLVLYSSVEKETEMFKDRLIENQTSIYVCKNRACLLPVKTVNEALNLLQ